MPKIYELGLTDYQTARNFQAQIFEDVKSGSLKSAFIVCRHYPVLTMGRQAKSVNLKASPGDLEKRGIKIISVERGGDVTYHGPGQLVLYPIINLRYFGSDLHQYLRTLESWVIDLLNEFGINAIRKPGSTGVWVNNDKISSIGIAVRNWISYHGLAINIKQNDLDSFSFIRPCGMDIRMTSMETVLEKVISFEKVSQSLIRRLKIC